MQTLEQLESERKKAVFKLHEAQYEIHRIDACIQYLKSLPADEVQILIESTNLQTLHSPLPTVTTISGTVTQPSQQPSHLANPTKIATSETISFAPQIHPPKLHGR